MLKVNILGILLCLIVFSSCKVARSSVDTFDYLVLSTDIKCNENQILPAVPLKPYPTIKIDKNRPNFSKFISSSPKEKLLIHKEDNPTAAEKALNYYENNAR